MATCESLKIAIVVTPCAFSAPAFATDIKIGYAVIGKVHDCELPTALSLWGVSRILVDDIVLPVNCPYLLDTGR